MVNNNLVGKKEVMSELYSYFLDDKKMALLVGDMGFSVLDEYFSNHADRVFNVGICEQAMVGMSAGMCLVGLKPVIYSQIPFLVMRAYEQIRYDINEHNLNVIFVGVGADNYFEKLGRSHCMDSDDIEMMSMFKNFKIFSPTKESLKSDIAKVIECRGASYVRCR